MIHGIINMYAAANKGQLIQLFSIPTAFHNYQMMATYVGKRLLSSLSLGCPALSFLCLPFMAAGDPGNGGRWRKGMGTSGSGEWDLEVFINRWWCSQIFVIQVSSCVVHLKPCAIPVNCIISSFPLYLTHYLPLTEGTDNSWKRTHSNCRRKEVGIREIWRA